MAEAELSAKNVVWCQLHPDLVDILRKGWKTLYPVTITLSDDNVITVVEYDPAEQSDGEV